MQIFSLLKVLQVTFHHLGDKPIKNSMDYFSQKRLQIFTGIFPFFH